MLRPLVIGVKPPDPVRTKALHGFTGHRHIARLLDKPLQQVFGEHRHDIGLSGVNVGTGLSPHVSRDEMIRVTCRILPRKQVKELALRLDEEIKLELADVTPTIISDEKLTKLRVDNVMDLAEERPMNLIHGRHVFRVAGFNMVLTDEGAAAFLQDARGTTFELVVDEVVSKQLFKAHTAALLEPGDYKLVVKSRAGDAEGPLQTSFRKVKYLKVEDPAPVDPPEIYLVQCADEPEGKIHAHGDFHVDGVHLANGTLDQATIDEAVRRALYQSVRQPFVPLPAVHVCGPFESNRDDSEYQMNTVWNKQVEAGYGEKLRAFDCSGLIMYWMQNFKSWLKRKIKSIQNSRLQEQR